MLAGILVAETNPTTAGSGIEGVSTIKIIREAGLKFRTCQDLHSDAMEVENRSVAGFDAATLCSRLVNSSSSKHLLSEKIAMRIQQ